MKEFNPNLYPPGGYRFTDRDGTPHTAGGWKDLKEKVIAYRTRNGQEVGDVWAEIMAQACGRVPSHCRDDAVAPPPPSAGMDFSKRIMGWLANLAGLKRTGQWRLVPDDLAARRASVCLGCPGQRALNESCGACVTSIQNMRRALLDGAEPKHQNLHPCSLLGEDCQSTVHAEMPRTESTLVPDFCWRKQP